MNGHKEDDMSGRLEGKVAAITGAASGFGATAARRFAAEGAKVVLGDIQLDAGQAIAADLWLQTF